MSPESMTDRDAAWPELALAAWKNTYATLHLWTQIVGKIRLSQTPWLNHSWHVVLYVTPRGLTTSPIPSGERTFQLDFDFLDHKLRASASDGGRKEIGLFPRSVADFYADIMRALAALGIEVRINELPNEIPDAIRFSEDHVHASYDREYAERFWRILVQSARVMQLLPHVLHRQMQPGPFLLGEFRSRRDSLLWTPRAAVHAERCRPQHAGGSRARCLFARMLERRLLAWWTRRRLPSLLFLCLAGAGWLLDGFHSSG